MINHTAEGDPMQLSRDVALWSGGMLPAGTPVTVLQTLGASVRVVTVNGDGPVVTMLTGDLRVAD